MDLAAAVMLVVAALVLVASPVVSEIHCWTLTMTAGCHSDYLGTSALGYQLRYYLSAACQGSGLASSVENYHPSLGDHVWAAVNPAVVVVVAVVAVVVAGSPVTGGICNNRYERICTTAYIQYTPHY